MSTRSAIIYKDKNEFVGIYCHFDGYPEHVGRTLEKHYNSDEKASELVALGDLSALYEKVKPDHGTHHSYERRQEGVTVAYHRDRGEEFNQTKGASVFDVEKKIGHNGYVYVWDGKWTCNGLSIDDAVKKDNE